MASVIRRRNNSDPESFFRGGDARAGVRRLDADAAPGGNHLITINEDEEQPNGNTSRLRWMMDGENRFFFWLSYLLAVLAIHSSVVFPLSFAFGVKDLSILFIRLFDLLFAIDVLHRWIRIFRAMEHRSLIPILLKTVRHPRELLELLALIPWKLAFKSNYFQWFNIIRALRLKDIFEELENSPMLNSSMIRITEVLCIHLYCVHITGCLFYQLATNSQGLPELNHTWLSQIQVGDKKLTEMGILQKYIGSIYFASVTLSTIGYGDIHAINAKEMVAVVCLQIVSFMVWTYLGANLGSLFMRDTEARIVSERLNKIEKHLKVFQGRLTDSEFGLIMEEDDRIKASVLNNAVFSGNLEKVKTLVQLGVDVNSLDYSKRSPLHVATSRGDIEIARFLINKGADVNSKDMNGTTPLLDAIKNDNGAVDVLIASGATLEVDYGEFLCKTVLEDDLTVLRCLLDHKVDPNLRNELGQTPLHIAASRGRYSAAKCLLSAEAATNLVDRCQRRPLDEARQRQDATMVGILSGSSRPN